MWIRNHNRNEDKSKPKDNRVIPDPIDDWPLERIGLGQNFLLSQSFI